MSALSDFLNRHGLDENFRAKAGLFASAAVVAAATLFAPLQAKAGESFNPSRDTQIGGAGMAVRLGMIAERTTDRIGDMKAISGALHELRELTHGRDGELAARIVIEINNRLYQDTPHPELAKYDMTKVGLPDTLEEGASMEYAVSAINFQKKTLMEATTALQDIVDAYRSGSRNSINVAVDRFDTILTQYGYSEPRVIETIQSSLAEMRSDEGWVRGKVVEY